LKPSVTSIAYSRFLRFSAILELAPVGYSVADDGRSKRYNLFVRPQLALEWEHGGWLWAASASYEASLPQPLAVGAILALHRATDPADGVGLEVGGLVDLEGKPGVSVAIGWPFLSLEIQQRAFPWMGATTSAFLRFDPPYFRYYFR
jgi:hypothetical protein